jgi:hypothetical protein
MEIPLQTKREQLTPVAMLFGGLVAFDLVSIIHMVLRRQKILINHRAATRT